MLILILKYEVFASISVHNLIHLLYMPKMLDKLVLDRVIIKVCEKLPLDFIIYEKDGFCERPNEYCDYCRKTSRDTYFCNKKTYTRIQKFA